MMKMYMVGLLPAVVLLFVLPLVGRPESQPVGESSASTRTVDRGETDFQLKSPPDAEAEETEAGTTSAAASAALLGREYVPPDALFVSVVFPRRTLARSDLADAPIERVLQKIGFVDRAPEMPVPARFLTELGIPLKDVEQVICIVTGIRTRRQEYTSIEQNPWLYGPLTEAYVVRMTKPAPRAAVDLLFRPREVTLGDKTYFGQGKETGALAVHFADDRTMIVGEERVVREMLAEPKEPSELRDALDQLDLESDMAGIVNVAVVREQVTPRTESDATANAPTGDVGVATFSVRLDPRPSAKFLVRAEDGAAGDRAKEALRSAIAAAREQVEAMPSRYPQPEIRELRELIRDLFTRGVNALKFERVEAGVEITLDDFASLGDLTTLLGRFGTTVLGHVNVPLPTVPLFEEDAAAATIRRLIPAAAGCRAEVLSAIARLSATPKPTDLAADVGPSMFVMMYKIVPPDLYENHAEEFRFDTQGYPRPSELAAELLRNRYLGYYSIIQADRITDFTCEVDGETARGRVSFQVPGLYKGMAEYVAERAEGHWRINEFHLPNHRWRFVRTKAGEWKWFTVFGDIGEQLSPSNPRAPKWPGRPVSGKITIDGKPLSKGQIYFYHTVDVQFPGIGFVRDGTWSAELPAGAYHVVIAGDVPQRYRKLGESGLMIKVTEGDNTFDFELTSQ